MIQLILALITQHVLTQLVRMCANAMMDSLEMDSIALVSVIFSLIT